MAITFVKKPAAPPVASPVTPPTTYTILDALKEVGTRPGTLMLVHRETGRGYQVMSHDPHSGKTRLKNEHGGLLTPILTSREVPLYDPVWR
jgi:hypothetical protein